MPHRDAAEAEAGSQPASPEVSRGVDAPLTGEASRDYRGGSQTPRRKPGGGRSKPASTKARTPWQINALRLLLACVLLGGGGGFGGWTYLDGTSAQLAQFRSNFDSSVDRLAVNLPATIELKRQAGVVISSLFKYSTSYRDLPAFEQYYFAAKQMAFVSGVKAVQFAPLVTNKTRAHFESFVLNSTFLSPGAFPKPINDSLLENCRRGIWRFGATGPVRVPEAERAAAKAYNDLYFPILYNAPMEGNSEIVLLDTAAEAVKFAAAVLRSYASMGTTTSELIYLGQDSVRRPSSIIYAPVTGVNDVLLGFSTIVFYWDSLFDTGLPTVLSGLDIVMRDFAGSDYTFSLLTGGRVVPRGAGDIHDAGMEQYKRTFKTTLGVTFTFDVYPQQALLDASTNSDPTNRLIIIMAIIAMCSVCFVLYDVIARRIANRLAARIDTASKIIDDVFPSHVKARLVHEVSPGMHSGRGGAPGGAEPGMARDDQVIADYYPESTILICDVVSFTKWSASVTPSKVFETLEVMFNWFDSIARRNGCFKVETVGDAYVASCGCPVKSDTHAVQMANMALDMLAVMDRVREESGVLDLRVRIGINSGPITAGVIRAQNRRFQLFGDTINSASRMESTGQAGRIQCSETTAKLLEATHILEPRRGLVEAKGKGKLKTFWLVNNRPDAPQAASNRFFSPSGRALPASARRLSNGSIHASGLCGLTLCLQRCTTSPQIHTPASSMRPDVGRSTWRYPDPGNGAGAEMVASFTADRDETKIGPNLPSGSLSGQSGAYSQRSNRAEVDAAQWLSTVLADSHSHMGAGPPALDDVLAYVRKLHGAEAATLVSACASPPMSPSTSRAPSEPEAAALQRQAGGPVPPHGDEEEDAAEEGEASSPLGESGDYLSAAVAPVSAAAELPAAAP